MKKILLYCLLLFISSAGYAVNINFMAELQMDGVTVVAADKLEKADVQISIKNLSSLGGECALTQDMFNTYSFAHQGVLQYFNIGLSVFDGYGCTINTGDRLEVTIEVTNASHKYAGYKGTKTFTIGSSSSNTSFKGSDGINLTRGSKIEVKN